MQLYRFAGVRQSYSRGGEAIHANPGTGYHIDCFEMLLVTADEAWHISRPLVDFGARQPVGVGDLTSGLLLVNLLKAVALDKALEHVTAAVYEVMLTTQAMGEYELQVVAAQDRIVQPNCEFKAVKL